MSQIAVQNLFKTFGGQPVLNGVSLSVEPREIISCIGPSGGGKSTLLRCVNLLEDWDNGDIYYEGQNIRQKEFSREQYRRQVGMIFQNFHLFNHLSVLENLNIGQMKVLGRDKKEAAGRSIEMLERVGLADFWKKDVRTLSGGQKQRVAIARSLCMDPKVLLLDEPTSALDPQMVDEVLAVIRSLSHTGLTLLIVTHEMRFAKEISHRILFLKDGRIKEQGAPEEMFRSPKDPDLCLFLQNYLKV